MAKVPIEVVVIGEKGLTDILAAIALANSEQNEFLFSSVSDDLIKRMQMHTFERNKITDFFDQMERIREKVRCYYPFPIAAIDSELEDAYLTAKLKNRIL